MASFERNADFAVGLDADDSRAVARARIDDDERPARQIELDARRRNDLHESVVDRPIERPAIDEKLHLVIEHVWGALRQMLAILVAALAHDVPEQHTALRGIDQIFHRRSKYAERLRQRLDRR